MAARLCTFLPTSINLTSHEIIVSEKFLLLVGAKVLNRCYFTVVLCLAKTYCLPILLYGCETWCMSSSDKHKLDIAWVASEKCLMLVDAKVLNRFYFTVVLPVSLLHNS